MKDEKWNSEKILEMLCAMEIFNGLSKEQVACFQNIGEELFLEKGEILSEYGTEGLHMYAVLTGGVEVHFLSHNKDEEPQLCQLQAGQVVGEMSLLDGGGRSARLKTSNLSHLMAFRKDLLFNLLEEQPRIGFVFMGNIARVLSRRLRYTNLAIRHQMFA
jgi:CRP-like cAMP-binding protein